MSAGPKFCRRCLRRVVPVVTRRVDRRTKWERLAGRPEAWSTFHLCADCAQSVSTGFTAGPGGASGLDDQGAVAS